MSNYVDAMMYGLVRREEPPLQILLSLTAHKINAPSMTNNVKEARPMEN
nr:hypothetical protein [Ochrobactrum sp. Res13-Abat-PEA25-P4-01-A]